MTQGLYSWSKTAASNATADATINWAEGMAPSAVNDSARAQMARSAEWRDDISGTITTGGTSTAYTLTSNQVFTTLALMSGAMIAFVPHATNGATVTLNVDGLGAKPLRYGPSLELQTGTLIQGTPYVATYNNSDAVFYLQGGFANPYGVPLGGMIPYVGTTPPNSAFVFPCGQAISRTTYATLFALTGTTYGVGDGSTTFGVPDLRGRAVFGQDGIGGFGTTSRITVAGGNFDGTVLGTAGGAQLRGLTQAQLPVALGTATTTMSSSDVVPLGSGGNVIVGTTGNATNVVASALAFAALTATTTITNAAGGNSHPTMPPSIILPYILRVI